MAQPNYKRDSLYDKVGLRRMRDSYLMKGEKSPQDRLASVCNMFSSDPEHACRLYDYASRHWLSFASPILSYVHGNKYSFPISCYLTYLNDDLNDIIYNLSQVNYLSVCGGGVSVRVDVRPPSEKSMGALTHIHTYDSCVLAYKQGNRRGSYAMYLSVDHPEIMQFIDIRRATGDYNMRSLNVHHAVNLSDKFMNLIERCEKDPSVNDDWELIDVYTGQVASVVSARELWQRIIEMRMETGEPYLCFIDTCNKLMNSSQYDKGLRIRQSNLCTEVIVPTSKDRSSLCCLSSINMEYYDDWKGNELFIRDIMMMLDNVLTVFENKVNNSHEYLQQHFKLVMESVKNERNIGIGVMGYHAYLQKKLMTFEESSDLNVEVFSWLHKTTDKFNTELGSLLGSPGDISETGKRFSYTMAVAPTATTSIIMGNTSPSIEPYKANIYRQDTLSGSQFNKNKYLDRLLRSKGFKSKLIEKIWTSITMHDGSVAHLPSGILNDHEKLVFRTFIELDQSILVRLAAERQPYIDQGQSLTLCFDPDTTVSKLHRVHMDAWKSGLKTMYYCRSAKISRADKLSADDPFECVSCSS